MSKYDKNVLLEELDKLRAHCAELNRRLLLIREEMREVDWMLFCRDHEEAYSWFKSEEDNTMQSIDYEDIVKIKEEMIEFIASNGWGRSTPSEESRNYIRHELSVKSFRELFSEYTQEVKSAAIEEYSS